MNPGINNQSSNDSLAQEFGTQSNAESKVLRLKLGRFLTKRNLVLAGLLALILVLGTLYFTQFSYKAEDVRVSNVSDRSATISWVTSDKSEGYVLVSKDGFTLPFHIGEMGAAKSYDDRDVTVAELESADKLSEQASGSAQNGTVSLPDLAELEVTQVGEYYVHHVTVTNLEPDSEYEFMIGNGSVFVKADDLDRESTKFSTAPEISEVIVPDPAYGTVKELSFAKDAITDGVVYLQIKDDAQGKTSTLISAPLSGNGSWYLDLANAKNSESIETPFLKNAEALAESTYHDIFVQAGPKGTEEAKISLGNDAPTETIFIDPAKSSDSSDTKSSLINRVFAATWTVTCPNGVSFSEGNATVQSTFNSVAGGDGESRWKTEACVGQQAGGSGSSGNTNPSGATGTGGKWEVSCNGKSYCENSLSVQGGFNSIAAQSGQTGISLWGQQACASGAPSTVCSAQPPQEPPTSGGGSGGTGGGGAGGAICGTTAYKSIGDKCDLAATCQLSAASEAWPNAGGCDGDQGPLSCLDDPDPNAPAGQGRCVGPSGSTTEEEPVTGGGGGVIVETDDCEPITGNEGSTDDYSCQNGVWYYDVTLSSSYNSSTAMCPVADDFSCFYNCEGGGTVYCSPGESCIDMCSSGNTPERDAACTTYGTISGGLYCSSISHTWIPVVVNLGTCDYSSCYCTKSGDHIGRNVRCEEVIVGGSTGQQPKAGDSCKPIPFGTTTPDGKLSCNGNVWVEPDPLSPQPPAMVPEIEILDDADCDSTNVGDACLTSAGNIGLCKEYSGILGGVPTYGCNQEANGSVEGFGFIEEGDQCSEPRGCECNNGTWVNSFVSSGGYCYYAVCDADVPFGAACEDSSGDKSCRANDSPDGPWRTCQDIPVSLENLNNGRNDVYSSSVLGASTDSLNEGYYIDPARGIVFTQNGRYCTEYENSKTCFTIVTPGDKQLYLDQNGDGLLSEGDVDLTSEIQELGLSREESLFSIAIDPGFNLISFPGYFEGIGETASEFLTYANQVSEDSIYSIAKFDSGRWIVVGNRDGQPYGDQDFQLVPGVGYLVRAKDSFDFNLTGLSFTDPVPTVLKPGWNLMAVHGTQTQYTAESLLDSFNSNEGFVSDNVTRWDTARGRYDGLQKEKDESDEYQVYGFDFPISKVQSYFVRVEEGEITWTPE